MNVNAKNIVSMMMKQYSNDPLFIRAKEMSKGKNKEQMLQTIQNICQQKGIDINNAFSAFQSYMTGVR